MIDGDLPMWQKLDDLYVLSVTPFYLTVIQSADNYDWFISIRAEHGADLEVESGSVDSLEKAQTVAKKRLSNMCQQALFLLEKRQ